VNPALRSSAAHVFVASLAHPQPEPDDAHHLFRVLRLRDGEPVTVTDGAGGWQVTTVAGAALVPDGPVHHEPAPRPCTIAAAIPKGDRVEWMVQKLTEVGATEIVFLHCARSAVRWDATKGPKQLARLHRVAREAAMQSRRVWLPVLRGPIGFAEAAMLPHATLADPAGSVVECSPCVIIGPEGGFSPEESVVDLPRVRLGDQVLRVETAAIVAACRILI
jgi:16S rRNA (uracil1498-N3)-methyltransferase